MMPLYIVASTRSNRIITTGNSDDTATGILGVSNNAGALSTTACFTLSVPPLPKEEDISVPLVNPKKPPFSRVMKMRNTDGRPIQYSTWKPVRMLCGRDNIGTRNFKKLN